MSEVRLSRREFLIASGAMLLTWELAGCTSRRAGARNELVVAIPQSIPTLDPGNHRSRYAETVIRNMYDGLVTRTPDGKIVPELATSWEALTETRWRFRIRRGVKWHDGSPFTAQDAAFTINRTVKEGRVQGKTSPRKGLLGPVSGAEAPDDQTLIIELEAPWPPLIAFLPFHEIVSQRYIERVGDDQLAERPMGTGPFKFVRWEKGSQIIMERFADYYGGAPDLSPTGPPKLERVIFRVIPETASRLAALKAGEVHLASDIPPDLAPEIEGDEKLTLMTVRGTRSFFIGMNVTRPPFNDARVRRAANFAIDMELVTETVLSGFAQVIPTLLSPDAFGYNPLEPYGYDPERARELLREAGYPDGFEITLDAEDRTKQLAQLYAQQLGEVGITARVQISEFGVLRPQLLAQQRDMWLTDWGNGSLDPAGILPPKLKTKGRGNYTGYSNPRVDELLEFTQRTSDPDARRLAFQEIQKIIYEEAPMVFGYVAEELYGVNKRVGGWRPSPDGRINLHDAFIKT